MAAGQVINETKPDVQIAPDTRARAWAFTVMNYTPVCVQLVVDMINSSRYGICGYEVCPSTGTPHLQGFVYWDNAKEFQYMRHFVPRARFSVKYARATGDHNKAYCAKEGKLLIEVGSPPRPGDRTDVQETYRILRSGGGMRDIAGAQLGHQCLRIAETWLKYHEPPRCVKPDIYWICGPPGSGKTRGAYQILGTEDVYTAPRTTSKFWDGYDGHANVLIDDIRKDWCKFVELLGITDRYAYQVEVKGSSRQMRATKMVITCPYTPEELFRDVGENLEQLTGRLTAIVHVDGTVCSRPPPRQCTLGPNGELVDIVAVQGNHATGDAEGSRQGPVQEKTPASTNQNIEYENNIGVQLTPANGIQQVWTPSRRHGDSRNQKAQDRERKAKQANHAYWARLGQEGIPFPPPQSLCSSGSDDSDGPSLPDYGTGTQDDVSSEDYDAYSREP